MTAMQDLLPPWPMLAAFCGASAVLAVTPGPGVFYIVTRSLAHGRLAGFASVPGVALGNLGNALGASLGLAALFAVSSTAFTVVKVAGAVYLVWLGIRTLRGDREPSAGPLPRVAAGRVMRDGFLVALLNPKTAMFFAAFLPQFMTPGAAPLAQPALLGALFVAIAMVSDTLYALAAGAVAPLAGRTARSAGRYVTGGAFIGLGLYAAVTGHRGR
jgi:threonine/homoserine/homoserine lactone efflux protein